MAQYGAPCGCPQTYTGAVVHRIACRVRVGTPVVFPPSKDDIAAARADIFAAFGELSEQAGYLAGVDPHPEEVDTFIEWAKQKLHAIALARAVLPSTNGKADPSHD